MNMKQPAPAQRRLIVSALFIIYAFIGLRVVGDYPIPMDEPSQDLLGQETWNYIRGATDEWTTLHDIRYQAPFVETIVHVVTSSLISPFPRIGPAYVMVRHLLLFLFFYTGVAFFYALAKRITGNWKLALLGCGMLILTPRFFAHSFLNSKDLPNVAIYTIAVWTLVRLLDRPTIMRSILHGIAIGAAISTRPMGAFLLIMTVAGAGIEFIRATSRPQRITYALMTGTSVITGLLATILFWPLLWTAPLAHALEILHWSQRSGGGYYFGTMINATPWHYLPVWIGITTPLWILVPFLIGIISMTTVAVRAMRNRQIIARNDVIVLLWVLLPWLTLIMLHAGIFDEWRHLFFLYPGLILIALYGVDRIRKIIAPLPQRTALLSRTFLLSILILSMASTGSWMVRNHPLQFAYFSVPSSWVRDSFDLDYWALSSRLVLRAIAERDDRPVITFSSTNTITAVNANVFFPSTTFMFVEPEEADYVIDNFRDHDYRHTLPRDRLIESITVDGIELMHVYRGPLSFTHSPDAGDPTRPPSPEPAEAPLR